MIAAALEAAGKFLDAIPGWVWALICAAALVFSGWQTLALAKAHADLQGERAAHQKDIAEFQGERAAAAMAQGAQAGHVLDLERDLATRTSQLEQKSAENSKLTLKAGADLHAAADRNGGRLLDPNAEACPAGGAAVGAGADTGQGAGDTAKTGRLLSKELTGLLEQRLAEADAISDAYTDCRQDALNVRAARGAAKFESPASAATTR